MLSEPLAPANHTEAVARPGRRRGDRDPAEHLTAVDRDEPVVGPAACAERSQLEAMESNEASPVSMPAW